MTDSITLSESYIKDFVFCDICACDGYPCEKVVFVCTGFRSEDEDGFAYKCNINEFENPDRTHIHRSLNTCTSYLPQDEASADQSIPDSRIKEHFDNESCDIWSGQARSDQSFRDAITFIDMLPELFPRVFKNKSKEFVN